MGGMPLQPREASGKTGGLLGQGKDSESGVQVVVGGNDMTDPPLLPGSSGENILDGVPGWLGR